MTRSVILLLTLSACSETSFNRIQAVPDALITTPTAEQVLRQGAGDLAFDGLVSDSYDGPDTLEAWWVVDGVAQPTPVEADGRVLLALDADTLERGAHVLGLGVKDSDGDEAFAEVYWNLIGPSSAPLVTITSPDDGWTDLVGTEITFRGEGSDLATPAADLAFAWTSSIDGPLLGDIASNGLTVLFTDALTIGQHTITLTVTDNDGETASDSITVDVTDIPEEPEEPVIVPAEPGDLVFSELNVNPNVVDDTKGEWVELYNTSGNIIDLAGYSFHDLGADYYELTPFLVPPHSYVVLCANTNPSQNGGVSTCDLHFVRTEGGGNGAMALGNNGDEVVLSRPDGVVIDQVIYNGSWFTPAVATGLDPSKMSAANNDDETMWCDQTTIMPGASEPGTPGIENDPCPP